MGRAICRLFATEGSKVVVVDCADESGEETTDMIKRSGGEAIFAQADVSQPEEVKNAIKMCGFLIGLARLRR